MQHVVPGTNPNKHIRTDSQIRAEWRKRKPFAGCVLKPPAKTSGRKVVKTFLPEDHIRLSPCELIHLHVTAKSRRRRTR